MIKCAKNLLIPYEENNHQPHLLRDGSIKIVLGLAIIIEMIGLVFIFPSMPANMNQLAAVIPSVLALDANEERVDEGKGELMYSELLEQAAQLKANDMASKGYFSHVSPDGKTPWYWVDAVGYKYVNSGENLAVNFSDSKDVHNAWMDSPSHKANIMREGFTEIGVATAEGKYKGKDTIFVVQFFGEPKSKIITPIAQAEKLSNQYIIDYEKEVTVIEEGSELEVLGIETTKSKDVLNQVSDLKLTWYEKIIASPRLIISSSLAIIFGTISSALILKIFVKIKIQHPKLIINGALILFVISLFVLLNSAIAGYYLEIL